MRSRTFCVQEERVLHVPCRVVGRKVERAEVVVVVLDLRAVRDGEPHGDEDLLDLVEDLGQRVPAAGEPGPSGEREVERVAAVPGRGQVGSAAVVQPLHVFAQLVERLPHSRLVGPGRVLSDSNSCAMRPLRAR